VKEDGTIHEGWWLKVMGYEKEDSSRKMGYMKSRWVLG